MGVDAVMYVSGLGERPEAERVARWSRELLDLFGSDRFIARCGLEIVSPETLPDGAAPGSWCIDVNLSARYYGPRYERGDPLFLCAVAEWLEQHIPGCTVWYGADSDDVRDVFDEPARKQMRAHFYGPNGRDYYKRPERKT